jgi:hypothetical protein
MARAPRAREIRTFPHGDPKPRAETLLASARAAFELHGRRRALERQTKRPPSRPRRPARKRKKDGAYPSARLSLASAHI